MTSLNVSSQADDGADDEIRAVADVHLVRLAEAFVSVWSLTDPMARAARGQQLFGKASAPLFGGARGPGDVAALVRSFERAIERQG